MAQLARGKSPSPSSRQAVELVCVGRGGQLQWSGLGMVVVIWFLRDMVTGPVTWVQWSAFTDSSRVY